MANSGGKGNDGAEALQPIIIKRKKVIAGGGHHGGAWKVAYADFVTAMMAFFLLMWLLNATTEDQRKGIADYFNPSIPLSQMSGGGTGALGGSTVFSEDTMAKDGTGGTGNEAPGLYDDAEETTDELSERAALAVEEAKDMLTTAVSEQIKVRETPEGLLIELVEADGEPLFAVGNAKPAPIMIALLDIVAKNFKDVANDVKMVGHTDGRSFPAGNDYTNWDLSTDRANAARKLLIASGFNAGQIVEVAGKADMEPLVDDVLAAENRRISITLLTPKPAKSGH